jgi:hypothetical protein
MLTRSGTSQGLQSISGWHPQIIQLVSGVEHAQFAQCCVLDVAGELTASPAIPDTFGLAITEADNHYLT